MEDEEECVECSKVLNLEKVMGITGMLAGILIVAFAADLLLGGALADKLDNMVGGGTDE
jgi:hypothetical protein